MSRINELINELCPEGVPYYELNDYLNYEQPTRYIVSSTEYNDNNLTPVLTAGQTFILGYTNEIAGIYEASNSSPVIIFDDFTTSFHWVNFHFKVKSSAMKILTIKDDVVANFRYIYFAMKCIGFKPQDHARHWISIYSKFKIPIPPLPVQEEIVRILDSFTQLEAELEAELEARTQQYEHYRNKLLAFEGQDVDWATLNKISTNLNPQRKPVKGGDRTKGRYPYYGASGIVDYVHDYIFDGEYLLISEDGANLIARNTPIAFSVFGKSWVNNHAHVLQFESGITRRFVEFYLNSIDLTPFITGAAQPKLNKQNLNLIPIPIPPIEEQERIVAILDKMDALVNDIQAGLPAEIQARKQQYEYYRSKLLTFKKLEETI